MTSAEKLAWLREATVDPEGADRAGVEIARDFNALLVALEEALETCEAFDIGDGADGDPLAGWRVAIRQARGEEIS